MINYTNYCWNYYRYCILTLEFNNQQGLVFAARHFLSLTPLDFVEENGSSLLVPTDTTRNGNSVEIETSLPFRRRFNCIVLAHGCDQHPVTETTEISKLCKPIAIFIYTAYKYQCSKTSDKFPVCV